MKKLSLFISLILSTYTPLAFCSECKAIVPYTALVTPTTIEFTSSGKALLAALDSLRFSSFLDSHLQEYKRLHATQLLPYILKEKTKLDTNFIAKHVYDLMPVFKHGTTTLEHTFYGKSKVTTFLKNKTILIIKNTNSPLANDLQERINKLFLKLIENQIKSIRTELSKHNLKLKFIGNNPQQRESSRLESFLLYSMPAVFLKLNKTLVVEGKTASDHVPLLSEMPTESIKALLPMNYLKNIAQELKAHGCLIGLLMNSSTETVNGQIKLAIDSERYAGFPLTVTQ